ncbi:hypothetical protein BRD56_09200 [Thermoplasmatales archaeon SW_10_69_26]|nr:MAG: hypothetical protein BRD56_09200 [Thermoplasmatales archaeon SW_10_69_26]
MTSRLWGTGDQSTVPVEKVCPRPIEIQLVGASGAEGVGDEGEPAPDLLDVLVGPLGELEQLVLADPRARVRVLDAIAQGGLTCRHSMDKGC